MITYREASRAPEAFRSLSGLPVEEFDALCRVWIHAGPGEHAASAHTREGRRPRQRAPGGGRTHELDAPTRLLMALVWLKVYPA